MRRMIFALTVAGSMLASSAPSAAQTPDDPYIWLEDVYGAKPMAWVEQHNAKTTTALEADPRYQRYYSEALAIAQAKDRIPVGSFLAGQIYNFWQDADHVRGIWRRATIASYATGKPEWETVLDLDALAAAEKANWVWKGAQCARPLERRCLINLSDGGEDAVTIREFDLKTKSFVKGGFKLPKGKQDVSWENENSIFVARHGSWNRTKKSGFDVVRVTLGADGRTARVEPFITGFLDPEKDTFWGRPADVMVLPDGSLLVSDEQVGAIYRVSYGR